MLHRSLLLPAALAGLFLAPLGAQAQSYPDRQITIVVPFSAGGGGDVVARAVGDALSKQIGKPVVIENVTGAGGTTGTRRVAQADPDGFTMVTVSPGTHSAAPALYMNLGYDPLTDFVPIGLVSSTPNVLIARAKIPAKTMKEFVAYLKKNEKKVTLGHVGPGSMTHLSCAIFNSIVGVDPVAAPYRGTPPLMQDLLGDRIDYTCQQPNGLVGLLDSGKIHAYAVADTKRSPLLPNVPTSDEVGMPGFKSTAWIGLAMPKGVPDAVAKKVNQALAKALDDPDLQKRFKALGLVTPAADERSQDYLKKLMISERDRYVAIIKKIGLQPQ
jgi:tripartite-type tricarboxylate transporter receptor subunit TctC